MKEKIKKKILLSLLIPVLFLFIVLPINDVEARSGCCSWHGGVCGCQCCDGTPLSSTCLPYYPECGGGSIYNPPSYDYPSYEHGLPSYNPSIPDCPFNSYYDSISGSCKCYSGYVASGGKCILAYQYCRDLLGFNARYNILTDSCECGYGYVISGNKCVSGDSLCRDKYGIHSSYDSLSESCKCNYGYVFDSSNQCVSRDDYCQDLYGYYAEYNILVDGCVCKDGYELKDSKCVEITPVIYSFYPTVARAGESVTVSGNNFGDYKGDVILNTLSFGTLGRISSFDIKSWNDDKIKFIIPEDKEPDEYYIRIKSSLTFSSKEAVSKKKLKVLIPLPEIYSIYPLEAEIGEEITISGGNFGDSKYGNLYLYIGNTKVSSGNIISWWDNKIVFEITHDLENGYVILKDNNFSNPTVVKSSYLEISEPEGKYVPIYSFIPSKKKVTPKLETQPSIELQPEVKPRSKSEFQPSEEIQPELQSPAEESQPSEFQEPKDEKQQEISDKQEQEQEQEQKKSIWIFLANILTTVKNFFAQLFR